MDTNNRGVRPPPGYGAGGAGSAYAALTREMWDSYLQNFVPIENRLIRYATDRNAPGLAMQEASVNVGEAFERRQEANARQMRGLGLTLDPEEQRAVDRSYGIARSLADVTAQNNARDTTIARQQQILGNPIPKVPDVAG